MIKVYRKLYFALLDSSASRRVFGGKLAIEVQVKNRFRRCLVNVQTADGNMQFVLGGIELEIEFQDKVRTFDFLCGGY